MVTEKTAREREAAALKATKPYFDKVANGLDYLKAQLKTLEERNAYLEKARQNRDNLRDELQQKESKQQYEEAKAIKKRLNDIEAEIKGYNQSAKESFGQMNIRCKSCGAFISQVQIVCHHCGAISDTFPYDIDNATDFTDSHYQSLKSLSESISNAESIPSVYDEVKAEINAMSKVKAIAGTYRRLQNSSERAYNFKRIEREADRFITESLNKNIEIAIVGDVKSGKSTLINALLGERMASVDCTPETAVLVKYHTTENKNYIKVSFYSEKQWEQIYHSISSNENLFKKYSDIKADSLKANYIGKETQYYEFDNIDALKTDVMKWTSSSSPEYFFVNEVVVGFCGEQLPKDVVLVDTPGLKDIVSYRSEITKKYLRKADRVLACISYEGINSSYQAKFIDNVLSNLNHDTERMIILGTKADMISIDKCNKMRNLFLENIKKFYKGKSNTPNNNFISVCAEPQMLIWEYLSGKTLDRNDKNMINNALCNRCCDIEYVNEITINTKPEVENKFGIIELRETLNRRVYQRSRKIIIEAIKKDYNQVNKKIRHYANIDFEKCRDNLLLSTEKIEDYQKEVAELNENIQDYSKRKQLIEKFLDEISAKIYGNKEV